MYVLACCIEMTSNRASEVHVFQSIHLYAVEQVQQWKPLLGIKPTIRAAAEIRISKRWPFNQSTFCSRQFVMDLRRIEPVFLMLNIYDFCIYSNWLRKDSCTTFSILL